MKKLNYLFLAITLGIFVTGCSKTREERDIKVVDNNITIRLESIVTPYKTTKVLATQDGYVDKIYVKNGDRVKEGDLIYTIDKKLILMDIKNLKDKIKSKQKLLNDMENTYNAVSGINLSAEELKKVAALRAKGYVGEFEENKYKKTYIDNLEKARGTQIASDEKTRLLRESIKDDQVKLKKLEYTLNQQDGIATTSGFITNLKISKRQRLTANTQVANIINIDKVIVNGGLAPGLLPFVHVGDEVKISFVTTPPYSVKAKITSINPVLDPKFKTMTVEVLVDNKNYILQNGTRALITIYLPKESQAKVRKIFHSKDTDRIIEIRSKI